MPFFAPVFLLLAWLAAPAPKELPEYARAKQTALEVLGGTRAMLEAQLSQQGPVGALDACSVVALKAATTHEQEGWRVRRVSLKPRNPADRPDVYETVVLLGWQKASTAKALPPETENVEVVTESGRRYLRYMKPILISGTSCLQCHGDPATMKPEVVAALREKYPKDAATGYKPGELRGAISVKVPLPDAE